MELLMLLYLMSVKHMTGVFSVFDHLTDVWVIHDIVIVVVTLDLFGFEFSDTFPKSFDFIIKILFSPVIKLIRGGLHLNKNSRGEWVASGRTHFFLENYNILILLR